MRFIDLDSLRGNPDVEALIAAAETTQALVASESDPVARMKLINTHRKRWVDFREPFETLIGSKCWYTESRNPGTDDDIDHFRPKGGVTECSLHGGYWWEAFNWKNLRLSAHRANRLRRSAETGATLGKGEHFPLLNEDDRRMSPDDACHERPKLLDPADPSDPPVLTYGIDGRAAVMPDYDSEPDVEERVEASRLYFHLDFPAFVEDRTALYGQIARRKEEGDRVAPAALDDRQPLALSTLRTVARDLISLTSPRKPYSKAALAYIRVYRGTHWVRRMVLDNVDPDVT